MLFSNPFSPFAYSPVAPLMRATAEVFSGVAERRGRPAWNVPATIETIVDRPFCRLVRFSRERGGRSAPQVLLVAPLSGHYATLLRGTIAELVAEHDVYVTDWADAKTVPLHAGTFDLDTYVDELIGFMQHLGPQTHVVAVCQPAPIVLVAVALMAQHGDPAQPRSMTLMGGPVDTRRAPTSPTELAQTKPLTWFSETLTTGVPAWYPGAGRRVYPGFVQLGAFLAMNPSRHVDAHVEIFNALVRGDGESAASRRAFYDEYFAVMDVDAQYYLQTVDRIFQRHLLPLGTYEHRGERVDPAAIRRTALFTVEGELDDISAVGQTLAAHDLCPNVPADKQRNYVQPGVGHYGIFNGRRWRDEVAPRVAAFIAENAA